MDFLEAAALENADELRKKDQLLSIVQINEIFLVLKLEQVSLNMLMYL